MCISSIKKIEKSNILKVLIKLLIIIVIMTDTKNTEISEVKHAILYCKIREILEHMYNARSSNLKIIETLENVLSKSMYDNNKTFCLYDYMQYSDSPGKYVLDSKIDDELNKIKNYDLIEKWIIEFHTYSTKYNYSL